MYDQNITLRNTKPSRNIYQKMSVTRKNPLQDNVIYIFLKNTFLSDLVTKT